MNNLIINIAANDAYDLTSRSDEQNYHRERMEFFSSKYAQQFTHWSAFYAAYSKRELSLDNLDFDEWAFLCEQMLYEQTESGPPLESYDLKARPDNSGLCSWRRWIVRPSLLLR